MSKRDPSERFVSLASARVNKVVSGMRSLAKLANRKNYSYSDEQARKISATLRAELKVLEAAFTSNKDRESFKL